MAEAEQSSSSAEEGSDGEDPVMQAEELEWDHLMEMWGNSHAAYIQKDRSILEEGRRCEPQLR